MFRFSPYKRYMMPAHFGPMHQGEKSTGWYRDVTAMIVPYLTDREKLAAHLPDPFTVGEQAVVTVAYARSKDVDWLAGRGYNLISVTASAVFNGENEQLEGQYSLVWWENLADAILSGREMTGIPKIFADIPDHTVVDGRWHSSVSHFDHDILDMSIGDLRLPTPEEIETMQASQAGKDHPMAWRYMPGVGGFGATVSEPTTFPSETVYTGLWLGEGKIDWNRATWEQNPTQYHIINALADLPVLEYLPAMVTTGSTNLFVPDRLPRVLDKKQTSPANSIEEPSSNTIDEIDTVCFVGAGTMGCTNALIAAISGYKVELYDVNEEILKQVPQRFKEFAPFLVSVGYCTPAALGQAFKRISVGSDLEKATANADLVSESVFEELELKREVHQKLDKVCPAETILTTNTSRLLVSEIEDVVQRGDRFAALHSYLASRLVDVVAGQRTSARTIDILNRYVESLGLVPQVLKKEYPGYVFNALLGSVLMTSCALVAEGHATREEVDQAYMLHLNATMGPFAIMDMIGLDLIFSQMQQEQENINLEKLKVKIIPYFAPFIEKGQLGRKTGEGFYTYPAPAFEQANFLENTASESTAWHALVTAWIWRAALIAENDVAEAEDIDRTWMIGTSLDTGPFTILKKMGVENFLKMSRQFQDSMQLLTDEEFELVEAYLQKL